MAPTPDCTDIRHTISTPIGAPSGPLLRISQLDAVQEQATVTVPRAGYLTVLAVVPGREIELILPNNTTSSSRIAAGTRRLLLQRMEPDPRAADQAAAAEATYERCVSMAQEQMRREATARVPRDSTGRMVSAPPPQPVDPERAAQARCGTRPQPQRTAMRALPPRAPAERYLVVVETAAPVPVLQLQSRLDALTVVASDVRGTIIAIVEGLLAGTETAWWGAYSPWETPPR